jgi:7,8-dihydroneopterin aldolase/epimerase/oxygenase
LQLKVNLGVTAAERAKKQKVLLNLSIQYPTLPAACSSDQLTDTICYDELIAKIKLFTQNHQFSLLESFVYSLYQLVKNLTGTKNKIQVSVTKFPYIMGLENAKFEISD